MRSKIVIWSLLTILVTTACEEDFERLPSGYYLKVVESKGGENPKETDALKVHLSIALEDSMIVDSRTLFPIGRRLAMNNMWPEFKEVLARVGEGDSVQVRMSLPEYAKLEGRITPLKDSSLMVTMNMRVLEIDNEASVIDHMLQEQLDYEVELIQSYLINNNLEAQQTAEGLFYIISQEGQGEFIQDKDRVLADYTLKLIDGTIIATTMEAVARANGLHQEGRAYTPYLFNLAETGLEGWSLGLTNFREGSEGTLIIPSRYAFGNRSAGGVVPPNAILVYELKVLEIQ